MSVRLASPRAKLWGLHSHTEPIRLFRHRSACFSDWLFFERMTRVTGKLAFAALHRGKRNTGLIWNLISVGIRADQTAASPGRLLRPTSAIKIERVKKMNRWREWGWRESERKRRCFQLPGISPYITAELWKSSHSMWVHLTMPGPQTRTTHSTL